MKKRITIVLVVFLLALGTCLFFILFKEKKIENKTKDDDFSIISDYDIYYKNKEYSASSEYNVKALDRFTDVIYSFTNGVEPDSDSGLSVNDIFIKDVFTDRKRDKLNYSLIAGDRDDCEGDVSLVNSSYMLRSSCASDSADKVNVKYTVNSDSDISNYNLIEDYRILTGNEIILAIHINEVDKDDVPVSNDVKVTKLNSEGVKIWSNVFKDKIDVNDKDEIYGFSYDYIGFLTFDNYDLFMFNFHETDNPEDDPYNYLISYKVDKKGNILDRKVLDHGEYLGYKVFNNKFYYIRQDYMDEVKNTFCGMIDSTGEVKTITKDKSVLKEPPIFYVDNYAYFLSGYGEKKCTIDVLDAGAKLKSIEFKANCMPADFIHYKDKYFIVMDSDKNELELYILNDEGEILKKETLISGNSKFSAYFTGFNINDSKVNLLYYLVNDNEDTGYNHMYEDKYNIDNLSKETNDFYVTSNSYLFIGKSKYSIRIPLSDEVDTDYFAVEISD